MATTLTPFLYQTWTILRAPISLRFLSTTAGQLHRPPREQSIPFEWEGAIQEERADIPSGLDGDTGGIRSTITPSERHIFRKIFDDLAKRNPTLARAAPRFPDVEDSGAPNLSARDAILSKYPVSLRQAAEAALGMREMTDDILGDGSAESTAGLSRQREEETHPDPTVQDVRDEIRLVESIKLQQLFDTCNTDVEVWDVLEQEVFSMVEKLGIAAEGPSPSPKTRTTKGKTTMTKTNKKPPVLSMDTHGPAYSYHLVEGLRALDRTFIQPSPLALHVLPRVKKLGLASFVLGVSTPFYNELASIYWYRHGDTQAVLSILDEMQHAGLFYDENTLRLIETIELALDSFRDRQLGVFSQAVGTMPGYDLDVMTKVAKYTRRVRHVVGMRAARNMLEE